MYRYDAGRTASCEHRLPDSLRLQWTRKLPPQVPAWKDDSRMKFDRSYMPVSHGGKLFVSSTVSDSVTSYDLTTGAELWRFTCGGPVRPAPAAWRDRVLASSDDGYLYCLYASNGEMAWKFRGGPRQRWAIGNQRVVSTWPARGGPVVDSRTGTVYFAAGIWPFMGTFVYALDIATGKVVWSSDETSFTFRRMPHPNAEAFSGLSAQGHLAIAGDRLIVPGAGATPALLDLRNGRFVGYGEGTGPTVAARGRFGFAGGRVFGLDKGYTVRLEGVGRLDLPVLAGEGWHVGSSVIDPASVEVKLTYVDYPHEEHGPKRKIPVLSGKARKARGPRGTVWLRAGGRIVVSNKDEVGVLDAKDAGKNTWIWKTRIPGRPSCVISAGGGLVVVTLEGSILRFGPDKVTPRTHLPPERPPLLANRWAYQAAVILKSTGATEGYALVLGLKDGHLIDSLLAQSKLHVVAVDSSAERIAKLRQRLNALGLYGRRASAIVGDPSDLEFAPYLASLVTFEDPVAAGFGRGGTFVRRLYPMLRPYGGAACLALTDQDHAKLDGWVNRAALHGADVKRSAKWTSIIRTSPPAGSAPWLGQNADAGNTRCSKDRLVKAPLGVLWWGNALSNSLVLPRHGEGPVEQVVGGRLFIEGPDSLTACDVYTGRVFWTRAFEGLGKNYISTKHQQGAHSIGSNFFATADAVYVSAGTRCHLLDPATGRTRKQFKLPDGSKWQFLLVYKDLLIAGHKPIIDVEQSPKRIYSPTSSRGLIVTDRRTGKLLWQRKAQASFRHYGICAGGDKLFCIDRLSPETLKGLARRGRTPKDSPRILAFDAKSGKVVWQSDTHVSEKLSYSEQYDVLIANAALRGRDGSVVWQVSEEKLPILWGGKWGLMISGDTIYPQIRRAFDLRTGRQRTWQGPDGYEQEWRYARSHGCGPMAGSAHMLAFRSACAAYFDLAGDGGTANLGGFRSGCTANLIAADGVLNAPDYTRTCSCAYQNHSSLALVHMPDLEYWTHGANPTTGRIAYNFGAPGDRRSNEGALWRATPVGADPDRRGRKLVSTSPAQATTFYRHSLRMDPTDTWKWVGASGVEGLRTAHVPLAGVRHDKPVTVRLFFAEPKHEAAGKRVFSVSVEGKTMLKDFDIHKQAGRTMHTIVREFSGILPAARQGDPSPALELRFTARKGLPLICGVEIIGAKPPLRRRPTTQPSKGHTE